MKKQYVLTLKGPLPHQAADPRLPQQEVTLVRTLLGDAPPVGTSVQIHANDEEWVNVWITANEFKQPHDLLLEIHLTLKWEGNAALVGLPVLRAVEILRDEGWQQIEDG